MAVKTISLEIDAYEKLKRAKRARESFSAVVRRARFEPESSTGSAILADIESLYGQGKKVPRTAFAYWTKAEKSEASSPPVSASHWD